MSLSKLQEIVKDREALGAAFPRVTKSQTRLSEGTTAVDLCVFLWQHHSDLITVAL